MFRNTRRPLWFARIALALLVIAVLSPTVSRAVQHVQWQTSPWELICSSTDMAEGAAEHAAMNGLEHCPMCLVQQAPALPPNDAGAVLVLATLSDQPPRLFLRSPRPLHAWVTAQPRAPPLV